MRNKFKLIPLIFIVHIIQVQTIFGQLNLIPDYTIFGTYSNANIGSSVDWAGDLNGDGFRDIIIGCNRFDNPGFDEGVVFVYYGNIDGFDLGAGQIIDANYATAQYGFSVSRAGDINNDGYDDFVVGAPYHESGSTDEGRVYCYYGSPTGVSTAGSISIEINQASAYFGYSVAGGGDINGDGFDDVLVAAHYYDNGQINEGRVYVYYGSATGINTLSPSILEGNHTGAKFGMSCSIAGDVNNDGFDDIIVGAPEVDDGQTDEGLVYIYLGTPSGISLTPSTSLECNQSYALFGSSVSGAEDVNADGYDDILIGASNFNNPEADGGAVFVYYGSLTGINTLSFNIFQINQAYAHLGARVMKGGDVNNDGYDDIIISATGYNDIYVDEGSIYVHLGSAFGINTEPEVLLQGDQTTSNFGFAIAGADDFNNDGFADIIISGTLFDTELDNVGLVNIYSGSNCISQKFYTDIDDDGFGNPNSFVKACNADENYVTDSTDCNDSNFEQNPASIWYVDVDGDKYYSGTGSAINQCLSPGATYSCEGIIGTGDCVDTNFYINPAYDETLDGLDNDCNGEIDEGFTQSYDVVIEGNSYQALLGYDISEAGDVNNDGYDDIIVGAPSYTGLDTEEGIAYVYKGSVDGIIPTPIFSYKSLQDNAHCGKSVSFAGDVNGDSFADVLVGVPDFDMVTENKGKVSLFLGSAGGINPSPVTINGIYPNNLFGSSVTGIGDVNNDGYDDIAVGDDGNTIDHIYIYHGSITGIPDAPVLIIELPIAGVFEVNPVDGAGDINGDGYDDLLVGSTRWNEFDDNGAALIYFGSASGLNTTPDIIINGETDRSKFGIEIAGNGDINGDGFKDIVVRSPYYDVFDGLSVSAYFVYYGTLAGLNVIPDTIYGPPTAGISWIQVDIAGDINNDSFDDVVVGNIDIQPENLGYAYYYYGSVDGIIPTPAFTIKGHQVAAQFGYSVSTSGDVNGDNIDDFMVSEIGFTNGSTSEGAVFSYLGACSETTFYHDFDDDGFGDPLSTLLSCEVVDGYVENDLDCNDSNNLIFPDGIEDCNGLDDNCNGLIDDGITETISISAGGPITFCQGGNVLLTATYSGATVQWKKNGVNIPGATSPTYLVTTKATYTCVTTSPCGTATSAGIFVNVNKNPAASITAGGATTFCAGGSVVLTANAGGGLSYQWYKGATLIAGATSINYTATIAGNYKCRVTKTATGCFKNSNVISVSVPCKEGELMEVENSFSIYPNPNDGTFTITSNVKTQYFVSPGLTKIEIYNNLGQLIFLKELIAPDGIINELIEIKNVVPGIYLIKLWNNNIQNVKNIIIE